jgi:hypothetical protein
MDYRLQTGKAAVLVLMSLCHPSTYVALKDLQRILEFGTSILADLISLLSCTVSCCVVDAGGNDGRGSPCEPRPPGQCIR